jgi:hypothetical protein
MIRDHRVSRRIFTDEELMSPEALVLITGRFHHQRIGHREQCSHSARLLRRGILRNRRNIIENPERAAM